MVIWLWTVVAVWMYVYMDAMMYISLQRKYRLVTRVMFLQTIMVCYNNTSPTSRYLWNYLMLLQCVCATLRIRCILL